MADHHDAEPHQHGSMDTTEHHRTFDSFVWFASRGVMVSVGLLIFLAIFNI